MYTDVKELERLRLSTEAIVFLDCHVRPMPNWTVALLAELSANPRRIAVPLITGLDPDTWEETSRDEGGRKMCLTWSVDFFWCNEYPGLEVPVLSGGLLAISRSWWLDSGGDLAMLVVEHSDTGQEQINNVLFKLKDALQQNDDLHKLSFKMPLQVMTPPCAPGVGRTLISLCAHGCAVAR